MMGISKHQVEKMCSSGVWEALLSTRLIDEVAHLAVGPNSLSRPTAIPLQFRLDVSKWTVKIDRHKIG